MPEDASGSPPRGERPEQQPSAEDLPPADGTGEETPSGDEDDDITLKSGDDEERAVIETKTGTPSARGDPGQAYSQGALIALTAIAGTAALVGAVYRMLGKVDPRTPLVASAGHAAMKAAPLAAREPDRPPVPLPRVTFTRACRSGTGWQGRWHRP
ncbi:hypothetical protein HCN51_23635 [Nonomuraea sp. FMUSA5-5]|uniref:Uncharacterized protein n=1 Tax=Nonomuraea composti TaxID=2720023 RepID=A0ABX1B3L7_9ACTN|nr:hypothetical protein [Nonomuraea sp. FMUSA5-5]NJP92424.1 hypothetical protein [Nonomuraea sp. FMUSA5-5]